MVKDDQREVYEVPLINTMVSVVAQAFAFGGATLHTFNSGAAQVPQASSLLDESLLKKVVVGWSVYGHAEVPLSIRVDGEVAATEDQDAAEPVVVQTREPWVEVDGLPLLSTIPAETILDDSLWIADPKMVDQAINFMGLTPWMVRPAESSAADPDELSRAFSNFERQVEQLRRLFTDELKAGCRTLLENHNIPGNIQVDWRRPVVLDDSAMRHGPSVKIFASCGVPLTTFATSRLSHARQLAANRLISQDRAAEAERWFS